MNEKMTLLFLKQTNQVLAVITRAAVPESAVPKSGESEEQKKENEAAELRVLAGENLIVRDLPVKLEFNSISIPKFIVLFPSTGLGVLTIELDAAVLINSREYFINSDKRPQLGFDPGSINFAVEITSITISLPNAVTADTGVWVQVHKKGSNLVPQTLTSVIKQNDKSTTISVQLNSGSTYQFLTSVAGYKPIIYERTVKTV